ncbi:hypothetical protein C8250_042715 [Streptomyces sp. So13.3]|uniref:hypothetical protein n=1 Tax=Streptomyces sp. So13.3 TaxID=2136173 RepID=UPI001105A964|nr:hypothetical protein [Streptomyces sp. So13.3]QNA77593.1 hypothetical protein C8250_042715 [Streptomyces sp. So13.3]
MSQAETAPPPEQADAASAKWDTWQNSGGAIPANYMGLSIEWSLVERYMGPNSRPAFVNLLRNLGTGVLRIGGSSQDVTPFDATAPDTDRVITLTDLRNIRDTLAAANADTPEHSKPAWGVVLGTAMSPPSATRPFVSTAHTRSFLTEGVEPVFTGESARYVAGIELGNEPDLSYGSNLDRYLSDLTTYSDPGVIGRFPLIAPNTSEDILPWQSVAGATVPTRYFWNWPQILDTTAARAKENAGEFGAWASDHFYPLARTCVNKPYRCPSAGALLSDEHMNTLDHQVYVHARQATEHGLGYRLEETNTAANRGADGVSNTAASATYALNLMFHTACPQPPDDPSANADCGTGAIGVNFHNAEVRAFYAPEEGNAYYNAVNYDPSPEPGAPTAAPLYYAMLLFAHFAQDGQELRPVQIPTDGTEASHLKAWQVRGKDGERRLFLINKSAHPATVTLTAPGAKAQVDRMTPYDPTGAGHTLGVPQVRIDGQSVSPDGSWPGFRPSTEKFKHHHLTATLDAGEAAVITLQPGS